MYAVFVRYNKVTSYVSFKRFRIRQTHRGHVDTDSAVQLTDKLANGFGERRRLWRCDSIKCGCDNVCDFESVECGS